MAYRSKTVAAWLAVLLGPFGAHRFYLHGRGDGWAWLHPLPTLLGLAGVLRIRNLGQDDHIGWILSPLIGLMLTVAMVAALVYALTPDERWDATMNPGQPPHATAWAPVFAAIAALLIGGVALMGAVAYGGQKFFEWQFEAEAQKSSRPTP
jgi:TM2 domain-containing membrane protein YozV